MKKTTKIILSTICIVLAVIMVSGYVAWKNYIPTRIEYMISDTTVNLNDPREVVGVKPYVFVGYVQELYDFCTQKSSREFPEIVDYYEIPFTECRVKVVAGIKGNLKEGSEFSFYKVGGIVPSRTCIFLDEGDIMPEKGKYYIFTGIAHADGTMTGGGTNGTIELEAGITENNLEDSKVYQTYLDAYENQILPSKGNDFVYLCIADENYGDGTYNAELYKEYIEYIKEKGDSIDEAYYKAVKSENKKIDEVLSE